MNQDTEILATPLGYEDWLQEVGAKMQAIEGDPEINLFGKNLIDIAHFIRQQGMALQTLVKLTNQQAQDLEEAGQTSIGYPEKVLHQDPQVALQIADGELMEALALLAYRHHQINPEDPSEAIVEAIGRSVVLFLSTLRHSPEFLNKFAMAFNFYSQKVQERMTTGLNAMSDTIH